MKPWVKWGNCRPKEGRYYVIAFLTGDDQYPLQPTLARYSDGMWWDEVAGVECAPPEWIIPTPVPLLPAQAE
jgi:hypothetical protein